jgi:hypothetical protein
MEIKCPTCNKIFIFKGGIAHFRRNKIHYCSRGCQNVIHGLGRRKRQDKRYKIWCNVKKRAKQKGTLFDLDIEDIPEIPVYCPILNIKLKANNISAPLDSSPSLDRINPKLGYIKGNVRIICNRANRIKSDATLEELKLILKDAGELNERI